MSYPFTLTADAVKKVAEIGETGTAAVQELRRGRSSEISGRGAQHYQTSSSQTYSTTLANLSIVAKSAIMPSPVVSGRWLIAMRRWPTLAGQLRRYHTAKCQKESTHQSRLRASPSLKPQIPYSRTPAASTPAAVSSLRQVHSPQPQTRSRQLHRSSFRKCTGVAPHGQIAVHKRRAFIAAIMEQLLLEIKQVNRKPGE